MKKLMLILTLFLACCSPTTQFTPTTQIVPASQPAHTTEVVPTSQPASNQETRKVYPPLLEAFESSEGCPVVCWLGIHPGVTTYEQAVQIITTSVQFDQDFTEISDKNIRAFWFPDKTRRFHTGVTISFSDSLVQSITLGRLTPFTLQDFIGFLGQPTEISLMVQKGLHDDKYTVYNLYYSSLKAFIQIRSTGEHGPEPKDFIYGLEINTEYLDSYRQPWLGYGHFDEYMLRAIPTPTLQTPP
jgi:hypothetical protein